ncbi:hypothetical protein OYC64_004342 [Pagothenia borchgrevinki]|uniref:Ubiquitin carboxyl-terminal hydrolase n=1 Tax=Pagothenia borchgrevinki TaxID=8213 RepID=A0ABD2FX63_PAGBO
MYPCRYVQQKVSNMWSRPAIKYHGLENQGSTCYLNSVLQVLFMTKDFREAVERFPSEKTEHIDLQLQSLFGVLKSRTAKTKDITKKLGIKDVYKQQDAAEYYEKILRLTSDDASKIFHGQLTHMTRCSSCGNKTGADGPFWHLPLALEGSYSQNFSVEKGIEEFFRASHFNGENQMYCDECRAKSDATTKCVIKHHPEVLTLLLKRFEFDPYYKRYVKVNCTVDVPCTLQIPENQTYELYAMVEHSGDLRSGHYIATIKPEQDGKWYSFNDSCVRELDYQPFQSDTFQNSSSAYLLFYRKEKVPAAGTQDLREESTPGGSPLSTCETQDQSPAERGEREEEDEGTAEEGKDPAFIYRDKETGIKDKDRVKSRKSGLSPDISNVESKEEGNDLNAEQQTDEVKVNIDDEGDMRRNSGMNESGKGSRAKHGHFKKQDESRDGQSEQSGTSLRINLSMDTEHHGHEGLGNIKHDNLEGQEKMQQAYGPGVEQQGDGLRTEKDVEVDKEGKIDGVKQNMSEDRQGFEARSRREDRRDVEGAKEQKRGDDKHAQKTETSMTEDQDKRGLDGVRQQKTSVPQDPKDVDEERPAKEQERKPFPNRGGSSRKQFIVKTDEEETKETRFGTERRFETSITRIITREIPLQPERLSDNLSDMKLSEPQKKGTKRHKGNSHKRDVPTSAIHSNAEKKLKVSDTQEQDAENQHATGEIGEGEISRGDHAQQKKNRNVKKEKTSCFPCKHANQTSE